MNINDLLKEISNSITIPNALKVIGSYSIPFLTNRHDIDIIGYLPNISINEAANLIRTTKIKLRQQYPDLDISIIPRIHQELIKVPIKIEGQETGTYNPYTYDRFHHTQYEYNNGLDDSGLCLDGTAEQQASVLIHSLLFGKSNGIDIMHLSKTKRLWNILVSLYYLDNGCIGVFSKEQQENLILAHDYDQHHTSKYTELCQGANERLNFYTAQIKDL